MADLFVYGTLMIPAVMRAVIGRLPRCAPAVLPGYRRFRLRGRGYPAVVRDAEGQVHGLLCQDLRPRELARLDRYEDRFYRRRRVVVRDAAGHARTAWCYVLPESARVRLSPRPWRREAFERTALRRYLRHLRV